MRLTDPIGPEGVAAAEASPYWTSFGPDCTPLDVLTDLLGLSLQAQLEEPSDDHAALILDLEFMDEDTLNRLWESLASTVAAAINTAIQGWLTSQGG